MTDASGGRTAATAPVAAELLHTITAELSRAVVGNTTALEQVLLAILAGGHVLLEDLPGLGKTFLARCVATVLGCEFKRIQFTPDLLPSDITGASLYDPRTAEFSFRPGPVFTQLLLADELNRTPPKTQAALLEAMAEGQVSVEGLPRRLPEPFIVIATQNPLEFEGTYPLPEAQLDRFLVRVRLGYLSADLEWELLARRVRRGLDPGTLRPLANPQVLAGLREAVEGVHVDESVGRYIVALLTATRRHPDLRVGASPRGGLALLGLARGHALLHGRDFVAPEDVKAVATPALAHRLTLAPELWVRGISADALLAAILETVPAPPATRGRWAPP